MKKIFKPILKLYFEDVNSVQINQFRSYQNEFYFYININIIN